ncbi:MAG: hypothetical protein GY810_09450 [Aureispira sp.]|nr:hypothetical protein [Aureispira sp.]
MSKQLLIVLVLSICAFHQTQAQDPSESKRAGIYEFNDSLKTAFSNVFSLRFEKASKSLVAERLRNPYNLMTHFMEDYLDFYKVFVSESINQKERLSVTRQQRLEKMATGDEGSPYFLFCQAQMLLHEALLQLKFGMNEEAVPNIKKAYNLLEDNIKLFPKFVENKMVLGVIQILVAATPGKNKWGNVKGSIDKGLKNLVEIIEYGEKYPKFEFNQHVQVTYASMLMYLRNHDGDDWRKINDQILDFKESSLANYVIANMYLYIGNTPKAFITLQQRPMGDDQIPFFHLEYLEGLCKVYRLDFSASKNFKTYLSKYYGVHYIKDTYQKLAWIDLLKNKGKEYSFYNGKTLVKGTAITPRDRDAQHEAQDGGRPNPELLKARLLFKGGYYSKAMSSMEQCKISTLKTEREKLEHPFRIGRIYHKMRRYDDALLKYDEVLEAGNQKPYYYAGKAALEAARIWENRGNMSKAKFYYERCLKQDPQHHAKVLHQEAQFQLDKIKASRKKK